MTPADRDALIAAARAAVAGAWAPYSRFHVGAALRFADGTIVTGSNVENASYGLSLCAETVATAHAFNAGHRGLVAVAIAGGPDGRIDDPLPPCGRCRQILLECAQAGGTDPLVIMAGARETVESPLSALLPLAFGPATLAGQA